MRWPVGFTAAVLAVIATIPPPAKAAALGAAASLEVDVELPGTLWEAGGHPILHNVRFREQAERFLGAPLPNVEVVSVDELPRHEDSVSA